MANNTVPSAAASRANATPSSTRTKPPASAGPPAYDSSAPTRCASVNSRATFRSIAASDTRPSRTASTNAAPHAPSGPGIARSCDADAAATLRTAVQSLITTPSKPHSEFSGVSNRSFSDAVTPLIEL